MRSTPRRKATSASRSHSRVLMLALAVAAAALGTATPAAAADCTAPTKLGISFAIDDSSSMNATDPQDLRGNGLAMALDLLPDGAVAGAGWFDETRSQYFPPTELNAGNRSELMNEVYLTSTGDATDFDEAFGLGIDQFATMPSDVDRKAMVLMTDGQHNVGGIYRDSELTDLGIPIYIIGLGLTSSARGRVADVATGGYFEADDEAALQAAFAEVVNELLCRRSISNDTLTLRPGETQEVPFSIDAAGQGWRGIVSWARGDFTVTAVRPDGTVMEPGQLRPDERHDASVALRRTLSALRPAVGGWTLRVTADADNAGTADVALRVFDAGEGTAIKLSELSKDHLVMFPRQRRSASLAALKGSPIHLYGQVYVKAQARLSKDFQAVQSGLDADAGWQITGPGGTWRLDLTSFAWSGPNLPVTQASFAGPRVDVGLESAGDGLELRLGLRLMRLAEYTQALELPVPAGYAAIEGTGGVGLEAGGLVVDMASWAATRVLATAGTGVLTGGVSVPLLTAAIQAQVVAQLTVEAAELAIQTKKLYGAAISTAELVRALRDNLPTLIAGLLPYVQQQVAQLAGQVVSGVKKGVDTGIKKIKGVGQSVGDAWPFAATVGDGYLPAVPLEVSPLRKQPSLRIARVRKGQAQFLRRTANRYAQRSRVRLRKLAVSMIPRPGRTVTVATVLPKHAVRGGVAIITLSNGQGAVYERAVAVTRGVAAAKVKLPPDMPRGQWSLSIGGYAGTVGPKTGTAEIAAASFRVKAGGRSSW